MKQWSISNSNNSY